MTNKLALNDKQTDCMGLGFAVGFGVLALVGDPAVDEGFGAAGAAEVFYALGVCVAGLPAGEFEERLVFDHFSRGKDGWTETVDPGHPPDLGVALQFAADVAVITLAS